MLGRGATESTIGNSLFTNTTRLPEPSLERSLRQTGGAKLPVVRYNDEGEIVNVGDDAAQGVPFTADSVDRMLAAGFSERHQRPDLRR